MKKIICHWNFSYLKNKIAVNLYQWRCPDAPWLTREAANILSSWLKAEDHGIEWGTGRSTIWLAPKVGRLISIEHKKQWYEHVKQTLDSKAINNVELFYMPCADSESIRQEYVEVAARLPKQSMDFALVDGTLRDRCVEVAMELLKSGGLLVIDNAERYIPYPSYAPEAIGIDSVPPTELWKDLAKRLMSWRYFWTSNGVFDTAFFIRPADVSSQY